MSAGTSQGTLDVDDRIAQTGCEAQYRRLEDCLDRHDRVWKQCQSDLHEFGRCMKSNNTGTGDAPVQPAVKRFSIRHLWPCNPSPDSGTGGVNTK